MDPEFLTKLSVMYSSSSAIKSSAAAYKNRKRK